MLRRDWAQVVKDQKDEAQIAAAVKELIPQIKLGKHYREEDLTKLVQQYAQGKKHVEMSPSELKLVAAALGDVVKDPEEAKNAVTAAASVVSGADDEDWTETDLEGPSGEDAEGEKGAVEGEGRHFEEAKDLIKMIWVKLKELIPQYESGEEAAEIIKSLQTYLGPERSGTKRIAGALKTIELAITPKLQNNAGASDNRRIRGAVKRIENEILKMAKLAQSDEDTMFRESLERRVLQEILGRAWKLRLARKNAQN